MDRILYPVTNYESTSSMLASLNYAGTPINSQLFGSFNEANMLAAIAVGTHFDVPIEKIASAIHEYQPTLKRSQVIEKDGYTLVIDCYNANPTSMELSLKDFFNVSTAGSRVIVIGDMFEVGETELAAHKDILEVVNTKKEERDEIICVGTRFSTYKDSFPFKFFDTPLDAKEYFNTLDLAGKKVFLKASRGIKLETILE